jgi:hypothetical protein
MMTCNKNTDCLPITGKCPTGCSTTGFCEYITCVANGDQVCRNLPGVAVTCSDKCNGNMAFCITLPGGMCTEDGGTCCGDDDIAGWFDRDCE